MAIMRVVQRILRTTVLALGMGFAVAPAQAATFTLNLTGSASGGAFGSFVFGGLQYDHWGMTVQGLGDPFIVQQGDEINATITLDGSFTIPASVLYTFFDLQLGTIGLDFGPTSTSGSTSFFLGGNPGLTGTFGTDTSGVLINSSVWFPPDNGAITFDTVVSNFTITNLGAPVELSYAQIGYARVSNAVTAVPEPETYAMMLAGLGLLGFAARRRKQKTAEVAA